jgi:hypothetical protein
MKGRLIDKYITDTGIIDMRRRARTKRLLLQIAACVDFWAGLGMGVAFSLIVGVCWRLLGL